MAGLSTVVAPSVGRATALEEKSKVDSESKTHKVKGTKQRERGCLTDESPHVVSESVC